jgi:gliding motility-associated-like protein
MKRHIKILLNVLILVSLTINTVCKLNAQSVSFGNTYVHYNGKMTINGIKHSFKTGAGLILPGTVGTDRAVPIGYFNFTNNGSYAAATDTNHVDGYVKTYNNGYFIFPIGDNGFFLPAAISSGSELNPIDAAYFNVDPTIARTSSLKGGLEPVLPMGGPFPSVSMGSGVSDVSVIEYWDINGTTPTNISLSWNKVSDVNGMTGGILSKLTILGWDGTAWQKIPSKVDSLSFLGFESELLKGTITTTSTIIPNAYNVYTIGNGCLPVSGTPVISCVNPSTNCDTVCNLTLSKTYKVTGMTNTTGYIWTATNGATIIAGQGTDSVIVNFSTGLSGTMQLCVAPFNNCDTMKVPACKSIFVRPTPTKPNAGFDQTICQASSISLSGTAASGAVFTWKLPNGSLVSGNPYSKAISVLADSGLYILSVVVDGCSAPLADTVKVTIIPHGGIALNTTGRAPICESSTKSLTGTPAGGLWTISSGGGSIVGSVYFPDNISVNTTVKIIYTIPSSGLCPSSSSIDTFVVQPALIVNNNTSTANICELSTKTLSATPASGSWTILSGGGSIVGNTYFAPIVTSNTSVILRYSVPSINICPVQNSDITFSIININNVIPVVTLPSTGGNQTPNINARTCVNGMPVVLGSNSKVKANGSWPLGITIDSASGKVIVKSGTTVGTYRLMYILCDSVKPIPNCVIDTIIVNVTPVINPKNDSATVTMIGGVPINNVTVNDSINGAKAVIGVNAFISQSGTWPSFIKLDPITGKVTVIGPVPSGTYIVNYTLCDSFKPTPHCNTAQIILRVKAIKPDTISILVGRYDTIIKLCTTRDDITDYPAPYTHTAGPAPKGYTVIGPDANGCFIYKPDSLYVHEGPVMTYQIICSGGVCDTTYIILKPSFEEWIIPNYISPNNDGVNDAWIVPDVIYLKYPNVTVSIYNRWGNIVWRSTGRYKNDWKGQLEGSQNQVPDGVYYYLLELDPYFKTTKTGFIEVMR